MTTSQESGNHGKNLPASAATIESIFSSPVASGPMVSLPSAVLIQGVGLEGDRYSTQTGTYSCLKASIYNKDDEEQEEGSPPRPEPGRQLTLISGDGVRQVLQELCDQKKKEEQTDDTTKSDEEEDWIKSLKTKSIGDFRRNIVLAGISASELLSTVGSVVEFSRSSSSSSNDQQQQRPRLLVHRNCVPCKYNERKNKISGLVEALWDSGGVSCEILVGGTIHVGDHLVVVTENENDPERQYRIDPGKQSSGFFVRPSKRTAAMVKDGLEGSKKAYAKLIKSDPDGVKRAEASYNSVGLTFWPKSVVSKTT